MLGTDGSRIGSDHEEEGHSIKVALSYIKINQYP